MKRGRSAHSALADFNRTKDAFYMLWTIKSLKNGLVVSEM